MTESTEDLSNGSSRTSSAELPTSTETVNNGALAALVSSTPFITLSTPVSSENEEAPRSRRRSSVSIIQAIANTSHLLTTIDARRRNFLVGTARQLPENTVNDINAYFPSGRLLTIMMVTWNTGEASQLYEQNYTPTAKETAQPKERMLDDISDIILPTFIEYVSDLIIVSTQEMSPAKKRIEWEILLQEVIGPTHVLFHSVHFGTLSLCIFLRRDLIWFCTDPEENIVKFRAVNPRRTKGSLLISFNLFGTSFMIINSHFEAGHTPEGRVNRRMNFLNTLTKSSASGQLFMKTNTSAADLVASNNIEQQETSVSVDSAPRPGVDRSKSFDCVLWGGDMNFRVDLPHEDVLNHCKHENYSELLAKDEFHLAQKNFGDLFAEFKEADIRFPPTYKFDLRITDDVYVKHRTPSYTDRILYRDKSNSVIECTQYKSVQGVKHSDHKPVLAHFRMKLKPGLHADDLSYGKFNHEVYRRGCKQRERHHSLGVDFGATGRRRGNGMPKSAVCVLQ